MKYCVYVQGQISLTPCGIHLFPTLWEAQSVSFWSFLMAFTYRKQFNIKEHVSLNLPSTVCNILEHFYLTKHEILLMFSCPSTNNFLVVIPDPQLNSDRHHKDRAPCDSSNNATSTTHTISVQSYEAMQCVATIHKLSEMTHKATMKIQVF